MYNRSLSAAVTSARAAVAARITNAFICAILLLKSFYQRREALEAIPSLDLAPT